MTQNFRLTLAQLNLKDGDLNANMGKALLAYQAARDAGTDLLALPGMVFSGYQQDKLAEVPDHLNQLAAACKTGPSILISAPLLEDGKCYNACFLLNNGSIDVVSRKHHILRSDLCDQPIALDSGPISGPFVVRGVRIGCPISEDAQHADVAETMAESGAQILLVPDASPYAKDSHDIRMNTGVSRVVETGLPVVYLNRVGTQGNRVFDGGSFVLNPRGQLAVQLPVFDEVIRHIDFKEGENGWFALEGAREIQGDARELNYRCLVEAVRGYVENSGSGKVLLELSGGAASALLAVVAVDALGQENVRCVLLPSGQANQPAQEQTLAMVKALGCRLDSVPMAEVNAAFAEALMPITGSALGNKSGLRELVLTSLGEALDERVLRAGRFNPISDLSKKQILEHCTWRNTHHFSWMMGPLGVVINH